MATAFITLNSIAAHWGADHNDCENYAKLSCFLLNNCFLAYWILYAGFYIWKKDTG